MAFVSNKRKLQELSKQVEELSFIVKTKELETLREESRRFAEVRQLLSSIRLKVKSAKSVEDAETGSRKVIVKYEMPTVVLSIDEAGRPNKNEFFYAVNMLELVSVEDMMSIQKAIDDKK